GSFVVDTAHQVVFLVGHDPRTGSRTAIPGGGVAVIGGLHGAVAIVAAVGLGVAIVETATGVVVLAVNNPILPLRLVVDRGTLSIILAKAHARLDEETVDSVAHDRNRRHV